MLNGKNEASIYDIYSRLVEAIGLNSPEAFEQLITDNSVISEVLNDSKYFSNSNNNNSHNNKPLLHLALELEEHTKICEVLIKHGANPFLLDSNNVSAFHLACEKGKLDFIEFNLEQYVEERKSTYKFMDFAIEHDLVKMVDYLIHSFYSASFTGKNNQSLSKQYLPMALKLGHLSLLDYLINKVDKYSKYCSADYKLIHISVAENWVHILEKLIANYLNALKEQNSAKQTALHIAIEYGNKQIISLLVEKGADLTTIKDKAGNSALMLLLNSNNQDIIDIILELKKDININDTEGNSLLHFAIKNNYLEFARLLINKGAKASWYDKDDNNALHLALMNGYERFAKELIETSDNDGLIDPANGKNNRPIHVAANKGFTEIILMLIEKGVSVNTIGVDHYTALHFAVLKEHVDTVNLLIAHKANINAVDAKGLAPMHLASKHHGNMEIIRALIEAGADVNLKSTEDNCTALTYAAKEGYIEATKKLINVSKIKKAWKEESGEVLPLLHIATQERWIKVIEGLKVSDNDTDTNFDEISGRGKTALHIAAEWGDKDILNLLLKKGASIGLKDREGNEALHIAVKNGHIDIVEIMLDDQRAEVNSKGKQGHTPLHYAVKRNDTELVKLLLKHKANPDIRNKQKLSSIDMAINEGSLEIMKELYGREAYDKLCDEDLLKHAIKEHWYGVIGTIIDTKGVEVRLNDGKKALEYALEENNDEVIRFLLKKEININCKDSKGRTVVHKGVQQEDLELLKLAKKIPSFNEVVNDTLNGKTPLLEAVEKGNYDAVKFLLENGADVKERDNNGETALQKAARAGKLEMVKYLIEKKSDVNIKTNDKKTLLHLASDSGNIDTVKFVVKRGLEVTAKDEYDQTPLHYACNSYNGTLEVVSYLIENRADVKERDNRGETALHKAARAGKLEMVKYLIEKKSDVNIKTNSEETLLHLASYSGNIDTVKFLVELGLDVTAKDEYGQTLLHDACNTNNGTLEVVKYLIEKGAEVEKRDEDGETALQKAAEKGKFEIVKYLTEKKSDVNIKTNDKKTLLHLASYSGNIDTIKFLVGLGLDVKAKDWFGRTPLHNACGTRDVTIEVVKYLIENGADVKAVIVHKKTALDLAREKNNVHILEYLVKYQNSLINTQNITVNIVKEIVYANPILNGSDLINKLIKLGGTKLLNKVLNCSWFDSEDKVKEAIEHGGISLVEIITDAFPENSCVGRLNNDNEVL
jgi:serine/threonine-protein phosphatase 6 regulatory ankyrin repeat subunit B